MIRRRTLRRKLSPMTVKKAGEILKSVSILHAKRKFHEFRNAYKYLLAMAYQNELHIHSLTLNNKSLAQTVQKEKENTALQLKERLNTESAYFELHKEYSLLKTKLSTIELNLAQINERMKSSMIPNLVRLSGDVTTLKLDCDALTNTVGNAYNLNNANALPKEYPRTDHSVGRKYQLISQVNVPSPLLEEAEDEVVRVSTRKCKGGLRNIFNVSGLRGDRKGNRSLLLLSKNSESSSTDRSPAGERSDTRESDNERSHDNERSQSPRVWPRTPTLSPVLPPSPAVLLRRALTPNNSIEPRDISHSHPEDVSEKKSNSSNPSDEDVSRNVTRVGHKRSTYTSFFGHDGNISHSTAITERKRSKRSHYFKLGDENKIDNKIVLRRSQRLSTTPHSLTEENDSSWSSKSERKRSTSNRENNDQSCSKKEHKRSSSNRENDDPSCSKKKHKKSSSNQENDDPSCSKSELKKPSSNRMNTRLENGPPDDRTLLGDRKRKNNRTSHNDEMELSHVNETKFKKSAHTTLGSEADKCSTGSEISFNESRRLRVRNNVSYKELAINVKMRKH